MDITTELRTALQQAVSLLRANVEPAAVGGERFDLTDATEMRSIFAALRRSENERCAPVTGPDPSPRARASFLPGELAFPTNGPVYVSAGLTKREYFAAMAMPAVIRACSRDTLKAGETREQMFARVALANADALIAALNAEPQQ